MSHYETSATVGGEGELHLIGVPFLPGTEVEIVVSPKSKSQNGDDRTGMLFDALDRGRNIHSVGKLRREELYDRNELH